MTIHLRDHVDCWCVSAEQLAPQYESLAEALLSSDERARADSFYFEQDRRCYLAAHAALRLLIARYTGESPGSLAIRKEPNGRPILENFALHISLYHSGNLVLIALSSAAPVGVDAGEIRGIPDLIAIAQSHFSMTAVEAITRLAPSQCATAFFATWKPFTVQICQSTVDEPIGSGFFAIHTREDLIHTWRIVANDRF